MYDLCSFFFFFFLQGYALALCEKEISPSMVLIKHFTKESKEDWSREVAILQNFACKEEPSANLLKYRWHSEGKQKAHLPVFYE